jgi:hypothetical protein
MKTRLISSLVALAALVLLPLASNAQTNTTPGTKGLCYSFDTSYLCIPHSCQSATSVSGPPCNLTHSLGVIITLREGAGNSITNVTVKRVGSGSPDCFMACVSEMVPNIASCGPADESLTPIKAWNTQNESQALAITSTGPGMMEVDITCSANGTLTTYPNYVTIP